MSKYNPHDQVFVDLVNRVSRLEKPTSKEIAQKFSEMEKYRPTGIHLLHEEIIYGRGILKCLVKGSPWKELNAIVIGYREFLEREWITL